MLNNVETPQVCTRCIMDTTVSDIRFDANGICNYCSAYFDSIPKAMLDESAGKESLRKIVEKIRRDGSHKQYDSIIGLSGGLDSSYTLYKATKLGLRPLAVHLDNGWDSELSTHNIRQIIKGLKIDLYTYLIDWQEFKSLQKAFFKVNVIDIEMLTDNAIIAVLYKVALEKKIHYIIVGTNSSNEGMRMPAGWTHPKLDTKNIKAIYKRFGSGIRLKTFPMIGLAQYLNYRLLFRIRWVSILNYMHYDKKEAERVLKNELWYRTYDKKHYESIFTRFYQGYIMPEKFRVGKRKVHYSSLICSGQMGRNEAIALMREDPYNDKALLEEDRGYVLKKIELSEEEFNDYIHSPPTPHSLYPSSERFFATIAFIKRLLKKNNLL